MHEASPGSPSPTLAPQAPDTGAYDPFPRYPLPHGDVETGHDALARHLRPGVTALDGPAALDWDDLLTRLLAAAEARGLRARTVDTRGYHPAWDEVRRRTSDSDLPADADFARLAGGKLQDLFDDLPERLAPEQGAVLLVFGPGAALLPHDRVWLVDRPKRHTLRAVQRGQAPNLGQPAHEAGAAPRHLFVDWPLLDRHRATLIDAFTLFVDATDTAAPTMAGGEAVRDAARALSRRPFRPLPSFLPGAWGGQWLRRHAGVLPDEPNVALGYELIAPESTIVLTSASGDDPAGVEVPFDLLAESHPDALLGPAVAERFGTSFPIRFDYLDTVDGGNLSIHCHPVQRYMREIFGWNYTQHESYYVMAAGPDSRVFLGLREDADVERFRREARDAVDHGRDFDVTRHVQSHPAEEHQLYYIPAGTPHASGADNLVLEISATPYLYSLRFFDWLRRDLDGRLRPVHVDHAFANLDANRRGRAVREDLIRAPTELRRGDGWREVALGTVPEVFFEVRRLEFDDEVDDATDGRFHLLNLVQGTQVEIQTADGGFQRMAYAETVVVPAATGAYRLRRTAGGPCRVVKAVVR